MNTEIALKKIIERPPIKELETKVHIPGTKSGVAQKLLEFGPVGAGTGRN